MSYLQLKRKISEVISLNSNDHELIETYFKPLHVSKHVSLIDQGKSVRDAFFY